MINDLKKALKLLRYGLNSKGSLISAGIFFGVGLLMTVLTGIMNESGSAIELGGVYMIIAGLFPAQSVITVSVSKYVQSSPRKFDIQVKYPVMLTAFGAIIMFTLYLAIMLTEKKLTGAASVSDALLAERFLMVAFFAMVIEIYEVSAFKKYLAFLILMLVIAVPSMFLLMRGTVFAERFFSSIPLPVSIVIAYLLILAGYPIAKAAGRALYKFELSENSYRAALSKAKS